MSGGNTETVREAGQRAGYVALVGRPNAGKSTLLNALIGEKLSIVTARAQTTRQPILGIYTTERVQIIFVDTPGLLEPAYLLQQSMLQAALAATQDADLVLLLLDATRPDELPAGDALDLLRARRATLFVAINKIDAAPAEAVERLAAWSREALGIEAHRISAATGQGVGELRDTLAEALPASPFFYPPDEIATQPVRFFVAELIRETIFEQYREEIPYSVAVTIAEFREAEEPIYIRATIHVERDSQKSILIGRGGTAIRNLGSAAREKIEAFVGSRVYLDLWVKVAPGWRRRSSMLRMLGYPVPETAPASAQRPGGAANRRAAGRSRTSSQGT
ncbi:MAG TPA: GTPase Era [Longimicrobiales bacterium]